MILFYLGAFTILAIGVGWLVNKTPPWVQIAVVIICSLVLAWLHWTIARSQLSTVGFAARRRDPNHTGEYIGYAMMIIGLLNAGVALKNIRYSLYILGLLVFSLPFLFLMSW